MGGYVTYFVLEVTTFSSDSRLSLEGLVSLDNLQRDMGRSHSI